MRLIIATVAVLLTLTMCFTACDKKENENASESQTHTSGESVIDTSGIDTIDDIEAVDPLCFKYLSYVFFEQEGKWCVARFANDYKTIAEIKAFEAHEVTVTDMLNIKTNLSMDVYDVVKMLGLPIDSHTMGMASMVFKSDCGAEATIYFSIDYANGENSMKASGISFYPETINFNGLKYIHVKQIMKSAGKHAGSETIIMQWDLSDGRTLKVWLTGFGDDNSVVSKYVIE